MTSSIFWPFRYVSILTVRHLYTNFRAFSIFSHQCCFRVKIAVLYSMATKGIFLILPLYGIVRKSCPQQRATALCRLNTWHILPLCRIHTRVYIRTHAKREYIKNIIEYIKLEFTFLLHPYTYTTHAARVLTFGRLHRM